MGAIPIIDGISELQVLRERASKANDNQLIGFFSQGMISQTKSAFMPGAAILALETGLPLVPVFIHSAPFYKGGSWIRIGKAIEVKKTDILIRDAVEEITHIVRRKVYELSIISKEGRESSESV